MSTDKQDTAGRILGCRVFTAVAGMLLVLSYTACVISSPVAGYRNTAPIGKGNTEFGAGAAVMPSIGGDLLGTDTLLSEFSLWIDHGVSRTREIRYRLSLVSAWSGDQTPWLVAPGFTLEEKIPNEDGTAALVLGGSFRAVLHYDFEKRECDHCDFAFGIPFLASMHLGGLFSFGDPDGSHLVLSVNLTPSFILFLGGTLSVGAGGHFPIGQSLSLRVEASVSCSILWFMPAGSGSDSDRSDDVEDFDVMSWTCMAGGGIGVAF